MDGLKLQYILTRHVNFDHRQRDIFHKKLKSFYLVLVTGRKEGASDKDSLPNSLMTADPKHRERCTCAYWDQVSLNWPQLFWDLSVRRGVVIIRLSISPLLLILVKDKKFHEWNFMKMKCFMITWDKESETSTHHNDEGQTGSGSPGQWAFPGHIFTFRVCRALVTIVTIRYAQDFNISPCQVEWSPLRNLSP